MSDVVLFSGWGVALLLFCLWQQQCYKTRVVIQKWEATLDAWDRWSKKRGEQ